MHDPSTPTYKRCIHTAGQSLGGLHNLQPVATVSLRTIAGARTLPGGRPIAAELNSETQLCIACTAVIIQALNRIEGEPDFADAKDLPTP